MKAKKRTVALWGSQEKEDSEWCLLEDLHQQVPVSQCFPWGAEGRGAEFYLFLPQGLLLLM